MTNPTTFDVRSLVSADANGKVNFLLDDIESYKKAFADIITGADELTITGPGPAWLHMVLWHAAHGVVPVIKFEAPGVGAVEILSAGVATGDGTSIKDGVILIDITTLADAPPPGGRVNFELGRLAEYQTKALSMIPTFVPGRALPDFEIVLTGPGPIWLYLALAAALHSRGGKIFYAAPNASLVEIVNHK